MNFRLLFTALKLAFIILTPVILLILPADFFDNRTSICLSKVLFHFECYACGLTRGIMHLIHLEFEEAFAYNMLSFLILPLMVIIWIQWFLKEWSVYKRLKAQQVIPVGKA
jgi:hypothetical protein